MSPSSAPGGAHTVLLVDDEVNVLAALRRTLAATRHRILVTPDPLEALAIIEREPVDVLIADIDMPTMNGVDLVLQVRRTHPGIARILLTGRADLDTAMRGINEGEVFRYLTKPWDRDELLATVDQAIARLDELRRSVAADQQAVRRHLLLAELEREHPGIGAIPSAPGAPHELDELRLDSIAALVEDEWLVALLASGTAG
jgi:two-component system, probable response regulator PhcQ